MCSPLDNLKAVMMAWQGTAGYGRASYDIAGPAESALCRAGMEPPLRLKWTLRYLAPYIVTTLAAKYAGEGA